MIPQPQFVHQEHEQPVVALSPGKRLQRSREGLGLSQADVASSLRLPLNVIKALEEDQHDGIHSTYLKGYLRSYARLVGVSTDLVVADVRQTLADRQAEIQRLQAQAAQVNSSHSVVKAVTISLCVGLLLLCVTWWRGQQSQPTDLGTPTPSAEQAPPAENAPLIPPLPASEPAQQNAEQSPAQESATGAAIAPSLPAESLAAEPAQAPTSTADVNAVKPATASEREVAPTSTTSTAEPAPAVPDVGSEQALTLSMTGESWIEISDANGKRLVKKLAKAGETIRLTEGVAPFQILLGNAAQIAMTYRGKAVDLQSVTRRGGVARFRLADDGAVSK